MIAKFQDVEGRRKADRTDPAAALTACRMGCTALLMAKPDRLAMVPVQWTEAALTRGLLAAIPVREELSALPMVAIVRADLPLTPAATHLLDLLKRGRVLRTSTRSPKKAA